jgi:hypothetical protein
MGTDDMRRDCRFWQSNHDQREVFAVVTEGRAQPLAYGPLALDEIRADRYLRPRPWDSAGDPALAADLAARADQFHDLEDFYRFFGYHADVLTWAESTQVNVPARHGMIQGGRDVADVASRLGLDGERLREAASAESVAPGEVDPEGSPVYHSAFWDNWAVGGPSGPLLVNPASYRFKAWLSFHT